jgi:hypothetical protein
MLDAEVGIEVTVSFGDKVGKVMETSDNLLTVLAPARYDLLSDTTVPVVVSNKYPHEVMSADKRLSFLYCTIVNVGGI